MSRPQGSFESILTSSLLVFTHSAGFSFTSQGQIQGGGTTILDKTCWEKLRHAWRAFYSSYCLTLSFEVIVWSYRLKLLFEVIVWSLQQEKPQRQRRRFTRAWLKKKKRGLVTRRNWLNQALNGLVPKTFLRAKKQNRRKAKKNHTAEFQLINFSF